MSERTFDLESDPAFGHFLTKMKKDVLELAEEIRTNAIEMAEAQSNAENPIQPGHFDLMDEPQYQSIYNGLVTLAAWEIYTSWVLSLKGITTDESNPTELHFVVEYLKTVLLDYHQEKAGRV